MSKTHDDRKTKRRVSSELQKKRSKENVSQPPVDPEKVDTHTLNAAQQQTNKGINNTACNIEDSIRSRAILLVKTKSAQKTIRSLASRCEQVLVRVRLRKLASQMCLAKNDPRASAGFEAALSACLHEAITSSSNIDTDQSIELEAFVWGLAWLARHGCAGENAGTILESLVTVAHQKIELLKNRDTFSAEFVLVLSRLFHDVEACRQLESIVRQSLEEEIGRLVTSSGVVVLDGSFTVTTRVVRWARVRNLAYLTGGAVWGSETEKSWCRATIFTLRLLSPHGKLPVEFGNSRAVKTQPFLQSARSMRSGKINRTLRCMHNRSKRITRAEGKTLLPLHMHCEHSAVAVMRSSWGVGAIRVLLEYRQSSPKLEISVGDRLLLSGSWESSIQYGDRNLFIEGPWTVSCFEVEKHAAFLEISAPLSENLRLTRQLVLLPGESVVVLADAIGPDTDSENVSSAVVPSKNGEGSVSRVVENSALVVSFSLECASRTRVEQLEETRECIGYDSKVRFVAIPLALHEWSSTCTAGELIAQSAKLMIRQRTNASRMYVPLWFDFRPSRVSAPRTWRQLTVAESMRILRRDEAACFRIQSDNRQWLLYQSLDMPNNRTALGCNMACDFLLGRLKANGIIERLIEIGSST
ncbi:MAG: hypothetical protein DWH94_05615 [Planctomycetota bacterium]|nr:MAG: hypothetical protein DWH94_05615 [Planctomycetota bacterium]